MMMMSCEQTGILDSFATPIRTPPSPHDVDPVTEIDVSPTCANLQKIRKRNKFVRTFVIFLFFFLLMLLILCLDSPVFNSYGMHSTIKERLTVDHIDTYGEIETMEDLNNWINTKLRPLLYCQHDASISDLCMRAAPNTMRYPEGHLVQNCTLQRLQPIDPLRKNYCSYVLDYWETMRHDNNNNSTKSLARLLPSVNATCSDSGSLATRIGTQNVMLGGLEIAIRKERSSCTKGGRSFGMALDLLGAHCFPSLDENEQKEPFGITQPLENGPLYHRYAWRESSISFPKNGPITMSSAYPVRLPPGRRGNLCFDQLQRDEFFQPTTRELTIRFFMYNPHLDITSRYIMTFTYKPTGYLVKRTYFSYITQFNRKRTLILEVLLLLFIVFYVSILVHGIMGKWLSHILTTWREGKGYVAAVCLGWALYFRKWGRAFDCLNLEILIYVMYLRLMYRTIMNKVVSKDGHMPLEMIVGGNELVERDLDRAFNLKFLESTFFSMSILITFLKMFMLLKFYRRLSLSLFTLIDAFQELVAFLVVFSGNVFSFILIGHFAFGVYVKEFRTVVGSLKIMIQFLLGDFSTSAGDYYLFEINPIIATLFIYGYIAYVVVFLLNIALAIIISSYTRRKAMLKPISFGAVLKAISNFALKRRSRKERKVLVKKWQSKAEVAKQATLFSTELQNSSGREADVKSGKNPLYSESL